MTGKEEESCWEQDREGPVPKHGVTRSVNIPVHGDSRQQWFQPSLRALTVSIQESDHLAFDVFGPEETGSNQP